MQLALDITHSEREAVKRHLISEEYRLPNEMLNKLLSKYEVSLKNISDEVTQLKMELDDRDLAFELYLQQKLKVKDIKNLIKGGK